jgi:hypothetical protein
VAKLGIKHNGVFIGAVSYPDRKRPCLVVQRGNEAVVIGTFSNVSSVLYFEDALKEILGVGETGGK